MTNLVLREQFAADLLHLRQGFDRMFHHILRDHVSPGSSDQTLFGVIPPIRTWMDTQNKEFHLSVALPGVKPEALKIWLQGNQLTFSGEEKTEEDKVVRNYLDREWFSYGRFVRSVTLPVGVDGEQITAELKDGILTVTAPFATGAIPKKIEIKCATASMSKGTAK